MDDSKSVAAELKKKNMIEQLWLHQFNQALLEKKLISGKDFSRMKAKINSRKTSAIQK